MKCFNNLFQSTVLAFFVLSFFIGCSALQTQRADIVEEINNKTSEGEEESAYYNFLLGVGDSIDIAVYREKTPESILGMGDTVDLKVHRKNASEFIIGKGDTLDINVYRNSDLTQSVTITPSGTFSFPLVGELTAEGTTTSELSDLLQSRLKKYIVDPQVMVSLVDKSPLYIDELSESYPINFQTGGKIVLPIIGEVQAAGQDVSTFTEEIRQRLAQYIYDPQVTIKVTPLPDLLIHDLSVSTKINSNGQVTMPLLGDIKAANKSLTTLRTEIEKQLAKFFDSPQVVISLSSATSQEMYVLGEVVSSQAIPLAKRIHVWESILKSGGYTNDANPNNVILIRQEENQVRISSLNLEIKKLVQNGNQYVRNGDILYVPPSAIANIENFMIRLNNILAPFLTFERAFIFLPEFIKVLEGSTQESVITLAP